MRNILLISTYDSFLNAGIEIVNILHNDNVDILIRLSNKKQLSERQINKIIKYKYKYKTFWLNNYHDIKYENYDVIVISTGNSFNKSFFKFYNKEKIIKKFKAITITLFPGVIFGNIDSILSRIDSDILLCNNKNDLNIALKIKSIYNLEIDVIHYGLPVLKKIIVPKPKNIYFFDQVKIPEDYRSRFHIIELLVNFSFKFPNEKIYIKSRTQLGERTVHINEFPYEQLLADYAINNKIPSNLLFSYKSIDECYNDIKLAITISSTVAYETIYNSIPTIILADLGIKESYFNKFFLESGCIIFLNDFKFDNNSINIDKEYYKNMIDFPFKRVEKLNLLIKNIDKDSLCINKSSYFSRIFNIQSIYRKETKNIRKILNWIINISKDLIKKTGA